MCHQDSRPCVIIEEDVAAEECLLVYCKPVELYNMLHHRALYNPSFLARSLNYKIEAKWKTGLIDKSVIFNYRDINSLLRKTEVTRDFTCPFCLMRCGSFKGLRCHLSASHDFFKCEFWISEEYRAVNVSVRTEHPLYSEIAERDLEPQLQSFSFCFKPRKRKGPEDPLEKGKHVFQVYESAIEDSQNHPLDSNETYDIVEAMDDVAVVPVARAQSADDIECLQNISFDKSVPSTVLPNAKSRRLSLDRAESRSSRLLQKRQFYHSHSAQPTALEQVMSDRDIEDKVDDHIADLEDRRNISFDKRVPSTALPNAKSRRLSLDRAEYRSSRLLQKRQFYHSHSAQPMALEQVMSDTDIEDKVDDHIADLEDRRMLDEFVDVSQDEKHLMHLWNSFVRKQRVLADGHVPWACEAFVRFHGKLFIESPALSWCWRLFTIKLWNHGLIDACVMNNCSLILQKYREEASADATCSNGSKPDL